MALKKVNAIIGLLSALLLATHNALNSRMMMLGRVDDSPAVLAFILVGLVGVHVIVSLFMVLFQHDSKAYKYAGLYKGLLLQRITGIAMVPLVLFHALVRAGSLGIGLIPVLIVHFFIMVFAFLHIPFSVSNALVTLGVITSTKTYKKGKLLCGVVCALLFLLGLTASISEVIAL